MTWVRQNAILLIFLVAVIASFVVSNQESHSRDRSQARQIVAGCISNSARAAKNAAGWHELSLRVAARGNPGDSISAQKYDAISRGIISDIPAPRFHQGDPRIAEARFDGERIVLTPRAKAMQKAGCVLRYS